MMLDYSQMLRQRKPLISFFYQEETSLKTIYKQIERMWIDGAMFSSTIVKEDVLTKIDNSQGVQQFNCFA